MNASDTLPGIPGTAPGHLLLVVEDDEDLRDTIADVLREAGYGVATARDGREAVEHLLTEVPCLVLLDLMMPVMNGWQVVEYMRTHPEVNVPYCVISAAVERAPEGAVCVLGKPLSIDDLLRVGKERCPLAS